MNRLTLITAITALASLCGNQLVADYTIKNNTPVSAQVYLVGQGWSNISTKSQPKGNLAYDLMGALDASGQYRTIAPGKDTTYTFENDDPRAGLPLDKIMVKFAGDTDFSKATPDNKVASGTNQTISLTQKDGKAHVNYDGGDPLGTPDATTTTVKSVNDGKTPKSKKSTD